MRIQGIFSSVAAGILFVTSSTAFAGVNTPMQTPLFVSESAPALNMLVMGRDHKLFYEAYNDASDLNDDGVIDVGFKPEIPYYGYFNSKACYTYQNSRFEPTAVVDATTKTCTNAWHGNFLNYVATSRMDALRKVLYGGYRVVDSTTETVLRAAFIPQDAHSWGKEYNPTTDGYSITDYTPLAAPANGYRYLFAVTTLTDGGIPQLRVLTNTTFRIWNWVSIERPVAGSDCFNSSNSRVSCTSAGPSASWQVVPSTQFPSGLSITTWKDSTGNPNSTSEMNSLFASHTNGQRCGTGSVSNINKVVDGNPFAPGAASCSNDNYHTLINGTIRVAQAGYYYFSVNGDDALDVTVNNQLVASWYTGHGWHGSSPSDSQLEGHVVSSVYLDANTDYPIVFRHEEGAGNDNWVLYWKPAGSGGPSTLIDYALDILTCPASDAALREDICKAYPNSGTALYKPTGLLHDFGESNRMYFGLLTGSYANNTTGGVLRSNMESFAREVNAETGQYNTVSDGIVSTINKLRITEFDYGSKSYSCGWITTRPINNGECAVWGNPVAEMMYETLRYFSGAATGRSEYAYSSTAKDTQSPLQLPAPTWKSPYASTASGGGGYKQCSKPVMTVISDINPSYDFKLPGSNWTDIGSVAGDSAVMSSLDVSDETDVVGAAEEIEGKRYFIGESNGVADSAPTAKDVVKLSTVRGLAPEEPSKQGTYYSAGIARFGANNAIGGGNAVMTYAVALASPLPKIVFPVGSNTVTVVPFAKSVGGSSISATGNFQPTDQIVDYYVEKIANTGAETDLAVNGGRPYAEFSINYEDVEQGADHDMDAIARYTLSVTADDELLIQINSEYAAGGIDQYMGYVISGTTADGIYLEVKDIGGADVAYKLNTPAGELPGFCNVTTMPSKCTGLPLTASRTFTPSSTTGAGLLNDPLWYAAKYGMPDGATLSESGDPENYFLVTNALTLKARLAKAFEAIEQASQSVTSPAVVPVLNADATDSSRSVYKTSYNVATWSGDIIKETTGIDWKASEKMPEAADRKILMVGDGSDGDSLLDDLVPFNWDNVRARGVNGVYAGVNLQQALATDPDDPAVPPTVDGDGLLVDADDIAAGQDRLLFIRGAETDTVFRARDSLLGDILNSSPVVVEGAQYLAYLADSIDGSAGDYADFAEDQATRDGRIYVGANDGMLHAFDMETGVETFAFIPSAVIKNLNLLTSEDYSETGGLHQFYVDGTPVVRDVYITHNGTKQWRTVLVGTLGAGGKSMFALDITDPDSVTLLWEFSDGDDIEAAEASDMGYSFPKPTLARLHSGQWAVVTGNGYDSDSGRAVLLLIDIETGELIRKLPTAASDTNNGLSSVRVADNNSDGFADYVYAGDLKGNLWRFDLIDTSRANPLTPGATPDKASAFKVSFGGAPLYTAMDGEATPKAQPITAPPSLVRHPSYKGYIVMFGTGRYFTLDDKSSTDDVQSLYGIWDQQTRGEAALTTPVLDRADLQQQEFLLETLHTFTGNTDGTTVRLLSNNPVVWQQDGVTGGKYGWYLDFAVEDVAAGERVIDEMVPSGQVLLFTTRAPDPNSCKAGLRGFTYGIDPYTGGRTSFNVFDLNNDRLINIADAITQDGQTIPPSGFETPAGGITLSNDNLFNTDGSERKFSSGPNATGRQSWQVVE